MVSTVKKLDFYVYHWKSRQYSVFKFFPNSLFNCRDKFGGNCPSFNFINKLKSLPAVFRLHSKETVTILTTPTSLSDVFTFTLTFHLNCFLVSHLGCACFCIDIKLSFHP